MRFRLRLLFTFAAVTLLSSLPASAAKITELDVGFGGKFKPGHWTPVRVTVAADDDQVDGDIQLSTLDSDGVTVHFLSGPPVRVKQGETRRFTCYAKFGGLQPTLSVDVMENGEPQVRTFHWNAQEGQAVRSTDHLILTLGESVGVDEAVASKLKGNHSYHAVDAENVDLLPDRWIGYETLDAIVFGTSDMTLLQQLSEKQLAVLKRWVALGGRVLVTSAAHAGDVFGDDGVFADFAPGRVLEVVEESQTADIVNYVSGSQQLPPFDIALVEFSPAATSRVQKFADTSRRRERPLIIHRPYGLGTATWVTVDLDAPPFVDWVDRDELLARTLRATDDSPADIASRSGSKMTHLAYDDMVGQLRGSLDRFQSVRPIAFSLVASLIGAYILLLGPGDYFFLKNIAKRMQWSWITMPLLVAAFAAAAVWLLRESSSGQTQVNQLEIIDVDSQSQLIRGTTWAHVYSPRAEVYSLACSPDQRVVMNTESLLSWQGLPGDVLGGLDARVARRTTEVSYEVDVRHEETRLSHVPLRASATKSLLCQWHGTVEPSFVGDCKLSSDRNGKLLGSVEYTLPYHLQDGLLFYGNSVYPLKRELRAGQTIYAAALSPKTLRNRLQSVKGMTDSNSPYDRADLDDVDRMLDVLMFYDLAGGASYTHLSHRYQPFVDLSATVRNGRAVLVGRCQTAATTLMRDGESLDKNYDQRWTYVRLAFPVAAADLVKDVAP